MAQRRLQVLFEDHRVLLEDRVRMAAWGEAIRRVVRPGDVVLDLGAGTGILGFLALRAGAARVHAVEAGPAAELVEAVARHNDWADRVVVHRAPSTEVELPERCDVLVSETLGSLAVDENTLPAVIDARRRLLRPGAPLVPRALELWLAPVADPAAWHDRVGAWRDVAGVDYLPAAREACRRLAVRRVDPTTLLARPAPVARIDLAAVDDPVVALRHRFVFAREGTVDGLAGWFRADLADGVTVDTAPTAPATHWKQAWLALGDGVEGPARAEVGPADVLDLQLDIRPGPGLDDTTIDLRWFCSQIDLPLPARRRLPCPCGSGRRFRRCCGDWSPPRPGDRPR